MPHSERIAALAARAAAHEAAATGKPGLVCADSRGAHTDMDISTMLAGVMSLIPYFRETSSIGFATAMENEEHVFPKLRAAGIKAETSMLAATGGVNTHKGLIFSMGLFCAAASRLMARRESLQAAALCRVASTFVTGIVAVDFAPLLALTEGTDNPDRLTQALGRKPSAGEILYMRYGSSGIRGEAEGGFKNALMAVDVLRRNLAANNFNTALLNTLLNLMSTVADTNVLWRGGLEGLNFVRAASADILNLGGAGSEKGREALSKFAEICLEKRLSPGGCADLLSLALFMYFLESEQ